MILKYSAVDVRQLVQQIRHRMPKGTRRNISIHIKQCEINVIIFITLKHEFDALDKTMLQFSKLTKPDVNGAKPNLVIIAKKSDDFLHEEADNLLLRCAIDKLISSGTARYANLIYQTTIDGFVRVMKANHEFVTKVPILDYSKHDFLDVRNYFKTILMMYSYQDNNLI